MAAAKNYSTLTKFAPRKMKDISRISPSRLANQTTAIKPNQDVLMPKGIIEQPHTSKNSGKILKLRKLHIDQFRSLERKQDLP